MRWGLVLVWLSITLLVVWVLHRFLTWMEDRRWIYYRRGHGTSGISSAIQELQATLEPGHRYTVEEQQAEREVKPDSGEPPRPPSSATPPTTPND